MGALLMLSWITLMDPANAGVVRERFPVAYGDFIGEAELTARTRALAPAHETNAVLTLTWTPYFPVGNWETRANPELVTYAYLVRMAIPIQAGAGEEHSGPIHQLSYSLPGPLLPSMATLSTIGEPRYGRQGIRPLTAEELQLFKSHEGGSWVDMTLKLWKVRQKLKGPMAEQQKKLFCQWANTHGVVRDQLPQVHEEFFRAMGCPRHISKLGT